MRRSEECRHGNVLLAGTSLPPILLKTQTDPWLRKLGGLARHSSCSRRKIGCNSGNGIGPRNALDSTLAWGDILTLTATEVVSCKCLYNSQSLETGHATLMFCPCAHTACPGITWKICEAWRAFCSPCGRCDAESKGLWMEKDVKFILFPSLHPIFRREGCKFRVKFLKAVRVPSEYQNMINQTFYWINQAKSVSRISPWKLNSIERGR